MNTTTATLIRPARVTYSTDAAHTIAALDNDTRYALTVEDIAAMTPGVVATRRVRTSHATCAHDDTKVARAKCRRDRARTENA